MVNDAPPAARRLPMRLAVFRLLVACGLAAAFVAAPRDGAPASAEPAATATEQPFRAWHFAEGNSHHDFQSYFSFLNLADRPASVMAYYTREDGIRLVQWFGIEPRARLSFGADDIVGRYAFGASFFSDQDIVAERSTTWGPRQNAETTVGFAPRDKREWFFAEGTTRGQATTYLVTRNLSDQAANATATFTRDDGPPSSRSFVVPPRGRDAFRLNDLLTDTAFATRVVADQDVVVERTIMSEGPTGIMGGPGYAPPDGEVGSRTWDFAEGSTRRPYVTYFVLFNPNREAAAVTFQFRLAGGDAIRRTVEVPALGRLAFDPRDAVPSADFGTAITADRPIVAERSYYSTGDGLYGALGYTATAPRRQSRAWYFAEGNTTGQIETFFVVLNLSDQPARARISYFAEDGRTTDQAIDLPAGARRAVRANDALPGRTFAARVTADQDILAERTFYFPGWSGFTAVGAGLGRR